MDCLGAVTQPAVRAGDRASVELIGTVRRIATCTGDRAAVDFILAAEGAIQGASDGE